MSDPDSRKFFDSRFRIGLALSVVSFLLIGVGLFAVVSALSHDNANLPHEGTIEDIANDGPVHMVPGQANVSNPEDWPNGPAPVTIEISRIDVDAPIIKLGFEPNSNNVPAVPTTGYQAAWYDFNPPPGLGYNALLSGHVDWQTAAHSPIPGVFYRLRELRIGDEIILTMEDGSTLKYKVTGNVAARFDDPNVLRAMGPTQKDTITIMTCGGAWEPSSAEENGGNYTHRIVVRAERVTTAGVG